MWYSGCAPLHILGFCALLNATSVLGADQPTFNDDVAPIVERRCAGCHRRGGAAPFALESYADVKRRASLIGAVVSTGTMPPWKPDRPVDAFIGERRLSTAERDTIMAWVRGGAIEGPNRATTAIAGPGDDLAAPDQLLTFDTRFHLYAEGVDTIRSFVLRAPLSTGRFVRAVAFEPGTGSIHHANIKIDYGDGSRRLDDQDDEPGFEGSSRDAVFPDGEFLGWTPGQRARVSAEAWWLPAGADVVVELHMVSTGKPELIAPTLGLTFTDRGPSRRPSMIRLGSQRIDIPAGQGHYESQDSYVLPVDVELLAVQPHAHARAKAIAAVAQRPDKNEEILIRIGDWDPRWQDTYRYKAPPYLPKGTRLEVRVTFDNSEQNSRIARPLRRATFGQRAQDEMGDVWLQVLARNADDRKTLTEEIGLKMLLEDTAGDETVVASRPADAWARQDLAACYEALGRREDALRQLRAAVALAPDSADGFYQLGTTLLKMRDGVAAAASLRRAIELKPQWSEAWNNLGVALLLQSDLSGAIRHFKAAAQLDPTNADALFNQGRVLAAQDEWKASLDAFRGALQLSPSDPDILIAAATSAAASAQTAAAVQFYRAVLDVEPQHAAAFTNLARLLASQQSEADRREAVQIAERAARAAPRNARVLAALAFSYHAMARHDEAIRTATHAYEIARAAGDAQLASEIRAELTKYGR